MDRRHSYPPALRILKPAEFKAVFDGAAFKVGDKHFLLLANPNTLENPRLGLVIAKKKVKLAVERNRIKRVSRESFRLQHHQLPAIDLLLIARDGIATLDNSDFRQAFEAALKRLGRKARVIADNKAPDT